MIRPSGGITVADAARALDAVAPPVLAQEWDNVGLLVGDPQAACTRILLCIDLTPAVLAEAVVGKHNLVVAYHPPLFRPIKRLRADTAGTEATIHQAVASGIAVYSPHTALDAAPGGTNDVLAELAGLSGIEPFEFISTGRQQYKVVTFVPAEQLEQVASAMFAAGAGRIGDYEQCSYRLRGEGTFFGTDATNPAIGRKGRLELVAETRIEVVATQNRLPEIITALRANHPYEEPAFDIYPLTNEPVSGIGRVGQLPPRTTLGALARKLTKATNSKVTTLVGASDATISRAAVCVGAAGRLPFEKPRSANFDVCITGEIRHHDALSILRAGRTAIALGHWESERPVLASLARRLSDALGTKRQARVSVSRQDRTPFQTAR